MISSPLQSCHKISTLVALPSIFLCRCTSPATQGTSADTWQMLLPEPTHAPGRCFQLRFSHETQLEPQPLPLCSPVKRPRISSFPYSHWESSRIMVKSNYRYYLLSSFFLPYQNRSLSMNNYLTSLWHATRHEYPAQEQSWVPSKHCTTIRYAWQSHRNPTGLSSCVQEGVPGQGKENTLL